MEIGGGESGSQPQDDCQDGRQVNLFSIHVFSFCRWWMFSSRILLTFDLTYGSWWILLWQFISPLMIDKALRWLSRRTAGGFFSKCLFLLSLKMNYLLKSIFYNLMEENLNLLSLKAGGLFSKILITFLNPFCEGNGGTTWSRCTTTGMWTNGDPSDADHCVWSPKE